MWVCPECFGEKRFRQRIVAIRPSQPVAKCDFHPRKRGIAVEAIAALLDPIIRENFAPGQRDSYREERGLELNELLDDLVAPADGDVNQELIAQLIESDDYDPHHGEPYFDTDYDYLSYQDTDQHKLRWGQFCDILLHRSRFFSSYGLALLHEIFNDIHLQRGKGRKPPVYIIHPEDELGSFYRARPAHDDKQLDTFESNIIAELGPPPERLRRAGRLNAAGIATFYGAFDVATCIAELRPSVGSRLATSKFEITRPICVLDTTQFTMEPRYEDIFVPGRAKRAAQWFFMQNFMHEISKPVARNDEHLDYLPTQAVAEFLNTQLTFASGKSVSSIDAIIYKSSQNPNGKNIAILGEAGIVGQPLKEKDERTSAIHQGDLDWVANYLGSFKTRISPVAGTFQRHRISGADYTASTN